MRKLLSAAVLTVIALGQSAIGATTIQGKIPVLEDELQHKDLKADIQRNVDLILFVYSHTSAMLVDGGELQLKPNLSDTEFQKRIAELEAVADKRQSIYLYDLISGLYAAKINATYPQGIFDATNPYAKKHIEYSKKCFATAPQNCDVSAYIGKYYMTIQQSDLSKQWFEKSSANGNGYGTYLLANSYAPVDKTKAIELYDLAIQQNTQNGKVYLNPLVEAEKRKLTEQN